MHAMVLEKQGQPLQFKTVPVPEPGKNEVLLKIEACGVCRTDLHVLDGDLEEPKLPLILGHEIIGKIEKTGSNVADFNKGDRIGVPWLGYTCGECKYCKKNQENLCENALFTGYTKDGGFSEYTVADQRYCFPIAENLKSTESTPLLCAGLIGYRSWRMTGENVKNLGIYGFGAAAHIIAQHAINHGQKIYAFVRPGDEKAKKFAKSLGAFWTGDSTEMPPEKLDAAIIFAPVGKLVPAALKATDKGGTIVCGGIHMSDIPSFPYRDLWEERIIRSVANLERKDGLEFLQDDAISKIETSISEYPLEKANEALEDLRNGKLSGAAVLVIGK